MTEKERIRLLNKTIEREIQSVMRIQTAIKKASFEVSLYDGGGEIIHAMGGTMVDTSVIRDCAPQAETLKKMILKAKENHWPGIESELNEELERLERRMELPKRTYSDWEGPSSEYERNKDE